MVSTIARLCKLNTPHWRISTSEVLVYSRCVRDAVGLAQVLKGILRELGYRPSQMSGFLQQHQ